METRSDIRAILFDYAGVITHKRHKNKILREQIEREFGVDKKALKRELEQRGMYDLSSPELGRVIHIPLKESFGIQVPSQWLEKRVSSDVYQPHVDLVRKLHLQYKTALVANSDGTVEERVAKNGLRDLFDVVLDSQVIGMRKPDAGIFIVAATRLGVPPRNCLFIDDKPENVRGAELLGMRGICFSFERGDNLEEMLAEHGVRTLVPA